jgi:hypothetical protein
MAEWLIRCESPENLKRQPGCDDDWLRFLLNELLNAVKFDDLNKLPIAFITFNYDRLLESLLMECLTSKYGRSVETMAPIITGIPIVHVHGDLGPLPWQAYRPTDPRDYSPALTPEIVERAASQIKIIHEASERDSPFSEARDLIAKADRLYFLGFGYHPINMQRLAIPFGKLGELQVHGSGFGLSPARKHALETRYSGLNLCRHSTAKSTEFLDNCDQFLVDMA